MKRYAKTALWITFGLLFVLIIVKVFYSDVRTEFRCTVLTFTASTPKV